MGLNKWMDLVFAVSVFLIATSSVVNGYHCPLFMRNQTACSCEEYTDGAIIRCNGPKGPLVVEELKKAKAEVRELVLENANIIEIGPRAFNNLRIKRLVLDNNKIRVIQKNAFRGLEATLQDLSIGNNRMMEVPSESLEGLRTLSTLNLRCNRIGNITGVAFENMPSLIEVNLGCNKICDIEASSFKDVRQTMQNIILDNNCLHAVPSAAIEGMHSLIALHLKYNHIERLGTGELRNMTSLSMLTLTGNRIAHVGSNFTSETSSLRYIYLGDNEIAQLEPGTMKQFSHAEIIDLSHNQLSSVGVETFSGMENLQHLNLESNAIKEIAPGAFATTPLLLLWLPYNCIGSVTPNMFQGTPFLKQVSLAHNNIENIQTFSFAHLANLHTLDLSHNRIKQLQPSAILGSDFLTVRVQENPFVCSQDGFHVMNGREAISLTNEPNLICKAKESGDQPAKCAAPERPPRQPCCNHQSSNIICKKTSSATLAPPMTMSILSTSTSSMPFSAATGDMQPPLPAEGEESSASSSMPSNEENKMTMRYYTGSSTAIPPSPDEAGPAIDAVNDSNNEEGSLSSATTMEPQPTSKSAMLSPMERLERARQRARKLNMERFMRLSKRPPMESAGGPKSKTESKAQQSPPPPVAATTMVPEPHPDEPKEQAAAGANKAQLPSMPAEEVVAPKSPVSEKTAADNGEKQPEENEVSDESRVSPAPKKHSEENEKGKSKKIVQHSTTGLLRRYNLPQPVATDEGEGNVENHEGVQEKNTSPVASEVGDFNNDAPAEHTNKQDQQNGDEGAVKKVVAVQQEVVKKQ